MHDELNETAVSNALQTNWIAHTYRYFSNIGSTNDELKQQTAVADEISLPNGTVFLTDYQNKGKGRLNRQWETPPNSSLLFSVLFRPKWPAERTNWLTMIASLAVANTIEANTNLTVGIKWPNDIMIQLDNIWHKVCGLLLEGDFDTNGRLQTAIMGIGLNVNIAHTDFPEAVTPPTSLLAATGEKQNRLPLFLDILQRIEGYYETAVSGQSPHEQWNGRLINLNQNVTVTNINTNQKVVGFAKSTTPNGELIVVDQENKEHIILAGDITMRQ